MRIRTIKPEFFIHDGLYEAEREFKLPLRIAFAGLWCAADREGRFKWEPRRLGAQILPYDGVDFSRVLHALVTRGFLVQYRVDDACFGAIPSWHSHQLINNRERASDIPNPSDGEQLDACPTRDPRVTHASKEEGKGREGKGKDLPPAAPDGRHHEITSKWAELYRTAFDAPYAFAGKDAATLKRFLAANHQTADELLATAQAAWSRAKSDRFAKHSKAAASIHGFCTHFNEIQVELKSPDSNANDRPSNSRQFALSGSYAGITDK